MYCRRRRVPPLSLMSRPALCRRFGPDNKMTRDPVFTPVFLQTRARITRFSPPLPLPLPLSLSFPEAKSGRIQEGRYQIESPARVISGETRKPEIRCIGASYHSINSISGRRMIIGVFFDKRKREQLTDAGESDALEIIQLSIRVSGSPYQREADRDFARISGERVARCDLRGRDNRDPVGSMIDNPFVRASDDD